MYNYINNINSNNNKIFLTICGLKNNLSWYTIIIIITLKFNYCNIIYCFKIIYNNDVYDNINNNNKI